MIATLKMTNPSRDDYRRTVEIKVETESDILEAVEEFAFELSLKPPFGWTTDDVMEADIMLTVKRFGHRVDYHFSDLMD